MITTTATAWNIRPIAETICVTHGHRIS